MPGPDQRSGTALLVMGGSIARAEIPELCALVRRAPAGRLVCDVGAIVSPDAVTVDALARMQLTARRLGREFEVRRPSDGLMSLVRMMGLDDVLLMPRRQAEQPSAPPSDPLRETVHDRRAHR